MSKFSNFLLSLCIGFFLIGAKAPEVYNKQAISIPAGQKAYPIAFSKIVVKMPRGHVIGKIKGSLVCVKQGKWRVQQGRYSLNEEGFNEVFRQELIYNNYTVVGDPDALFVDESLSSARYLVAGLITDLRGNVCFPHSGFGNLDKAKGDAYLKVEWQVYSTLDRQVVYKTTTEGSFRLKKSEAGGFMYLFEQAFGNAVNNLLADRGFYDLIVPSPEDFQRQTFPALKISTSFPFEQNGPASIAEAQESVVTVRSPTGHGSGFFISENGYLLTNEHVVGESQTVRIILSNGLEMDGQVVRKEKRRDIALVKIPIGGTKPLKIANQQIGVGNMVFAIGSPLEEELQGTVSSGIVSSFREIEGESYIQSDVMVHQGNSGGPLLNENFEVIGLSARGVILLGVGVGLNFFIPIEDGLNVLNLATE